jgi:hypothetical protein
MILTGAEWQAFEPVCSGTRPRPAAHRPSFGSAAQSRRTLQSPCAARYASSLTSCASQAASCCWLLLFTVQTHLHITLANSVHWGREPFLAVKQTLCTRARAPQKTD